MVEISIIELLQRCLSGKSNKAIMFFRLLRRCKAYIVQIRPIYGKEIHGFFESARLGVTRGVVAMPGKNASRTNAVDCN